MSVNNRTYAFGYYGGKLTHLNRLLPLLPQCTTFVEPFAGSGAVLLNREPSPVEVYNDLDGEIVNFFRVLRTQGEQLKRQLELTPYSREEFSQACSSDGTLDDMERARRFFVRIAQSRANLPLTSVGQWSYSVKPTGAVSAWMSNVDGLDAVIARLQTVQIEHLDALDCIHRYDRKDTLFYVDPPYLSYTRTDSACYVHEMNEADHIALAVNLRSCVGRVAISGYPSALYDQLYAGWYTTTRGARATTHHENVTGSRTEVLWTNYDPDIVQGRTSMFSLLDAKGNAR